MDERIDIGLSAAYHRFEEEERSRDALDNKASMVLGFVAVVMGILSGVLSSLVGKTLQGMGCYFLLIALGLGLIIILLAAISALGALTVREFSAGPGGQILFSASERLDGPHLKKKLLDVYCRAFQNNWEQNQRKALLVTVSFVVMILGTSIILAALLVFVGLGG